MKKIICCLLLLPFFVFAKEIKYKDWHVNIDIDPITDKKNVSIFAGDVTKAQASESAALMFNCELVALVPLSKNWGYNEGDKIKIIYRVDKEKPIEMEWVMHIGNAIAKKEDFMNKPIQNGKKIVVRAGTESPRDFTFSLSGYKKAYKRLEKECAN
ncbi:hypothetical protein B5800_11925 [Gilliamella apicola]|uniref:hypothetical protein n=2 Tax=Gilliamella apicola TaxID=1196095 RepID=UPI000A035EA7|nr:hypothetical protein [Gilliamella apicola]ORF44385.1 hypothetical protein B5800_11925 [Gilliamella apicola]ORF47657.1 hypothetical protein B5799_11860 [Gilliamella apicola]ORF51209.1 hypothetical protein B5802_11610 [Gilliamella apicola]ORF52610.1 hypothetical protein B5798_11385 [Gilliamella apicola]ORF59039.1 hypothetical protein B5804_11770 [Gilliamella apicola]